MESSHGLMVDATKANGKMANKMEKVFIATKKELKDQDYGLMAKKLNGLIDINLF
jgi:hypothetical protein